MDKDIIEFVPAENVEDEDRIVKFSKTYKFEGREYSEVDLSGLENITAVDMIEADKYLVRNAVVSMQPEANLSYTIFLASRVTKIPIEFFKGLNMKDAIKIRLAVANFCYAED